VPKRPVPAMLAAMKTPPGPPPVSRNPLALARYFLSIRGDILSFVGRRFREHGDLYYAQLGATRLYVTRDPEQVRDVLVTKGQSFGKTTTGNAARQLNRVLGDGLLNSNGELWRRQRRLINPAFDRRRVEAQAPGMVAATLEMLEGWEPGGHIDLSREMMHLTLRIVARSLFDHDASGDADTVARAMEALRGMVSTPVFLPSWLPIPALRRAQRALEDMDAIVYGLIDERLRDPARTASRPDLLSAMVGSVDLDGDGASMDRKLLRDEVLTLFLAGHETTSHALTWTLYLLSQNPEARAEVQAELSRELAGSPVTAADLGRLPLLEAAFNEGMRLYPPAYVTSRMALEDVEIGGYTIPEGAEILVWIYWLHRHPDYWPDPTRYDVHRFDPEVAAARPKTAFIPFGAGTRSCIGKHFAMMEARLILATLLQRTTLDHAHGHVVELAPAVTLAPKHGMRMRVRHTAAEGPSA
jgi:cytochrome P450